MSLTAKAIAVCPKCREEHKINIYKSINVAENPELKEKVKDGSIFLWECPQCGSVNLARYDSLYHDPQKKLMVWLLPSGSVSEAQIQSIGAQVKTMEGYTLRRVDDAGSLMEKVLIKEAGLDDIAIELCKWVTKQEMLSGASSEQEKERVAARKLHFYSVEGEGESRLITFTFAEDGKMLGVKSGWNVYEDSFGILERNLQVRPEEGFARVDEEWMSSVIK